MPDNNDFDRTGTILFMRALLDAFKDDHPLLPRLPFKPSTNLATDVIAPLEAIIQETESAIQGAGTSVEQFIVQIVQLFAFFTEMDDLLNDPNLVLSADDDPNIAAVDVITNPDLVIARYIMQKMPRLGAALAFVGIIEYTITDAAGPPQLTINFERLFLLLTDPEALLAQTVLSDDFWSVMLEGEDADPMPPWVALLGAIIAAPQIAFALQNNRLYAAPLPIPSTNPTSTSGWPVFRADMRHWVGVTINIPHIDNPDPVNDLAFIPAMTFNDVLFNQSAIMDPAFSLTLAFRGVNVGNIRSTNEDDWFRWFFEIWLGFYQSANLSLGQYGQGIDIPLGSGWILNFRPTLSAGAGFAAGFAYDELADDTHFSIQSLGIENIEDVFTPTQGASLLEINLRKESEGGGSDILIGSPGGSRLEIQSIGARAVVRHKTWTPNGQNNANRPGFEIGFTLVNLAAVLSGRYLDLLGDLALNTNGSLLFRLDLDVSYQEGVGFQTQAGASLQALLGIDTTFNVNQQLGSDSLNLTIDTIRLRAEARLINAQLGVRFRLLFTASATLGPVFVMLDEMGAYFGYWGENSLDAAFDFEPPSGIAIKIDAPSVSGGGFIQKASQSNSNPRYQGALSLKIAEFTVTAYGIYEKTPAGNVSFVIVIGARFPGIQLGFGFSLTGIGGLIGINRRAEVDLLRARLTSGATGNVLFCDDPIANAPTIMGDLDSFFPMADGIYLIGPTLQISWIAIVRFDLAILIELPGPSKIVILGSVRASILGASPEIALVKLRMDILGVIDFDQKLLAFDASLVDSSVLDILTLTGDVAFRLSWGAMPYVVLSIGGFHPAFNPGPMIDRVLARATASFEVGSGAKIWLRQEMYFAFTSNSLQLGGRTEAGLKLGPVRAEGFFSFDVLVQFKPFYFIFDFSAGFSIKVFGVSLASITINGTISGPGPLIVKGKVRVKLLFFTVKASATFKLGSEGGDTLPTIPRLLEIMAGEIGIPENLEATEGVDRDVRYVEAPEPPPGGAPLISPYGGLRWSQKRAPFKIGIERFEGNALEGGQHCLMVGVIDPDTSDVSASAPITRDWFSPGNFIDLEDSEKLNRPAFETLQNGVCITTPDDTIAAEVPYAGFVDLITLPDWEHSELPMLFYALHLIIEMQNEREGTSEVDSGEPAVGIAPEEWNVYLPNGEIQTVDSQTEAHQTAALYGGIATPATQQVVNVEV